MSGIADILKGAQSWYGRQLTAAPPWPSTIQPVSRLQFPLLQNGLLTVQQRVQKLDAETLTPV